MARRSKVLDSWALLAFLEDEPSADRVEAMIVEAQRTGESLMVTSVNLGEVWYSIARSRSEGAADRAVEEIGRLGIETIAVDWELARVAARLKANRKLAFADCFAAALAQQKRTDVVTGDPEFRQLEPEVRITWLR